VAHRIDDAINLSLRHAIHGFLGDPGCHRFLVGVDAPVGQQIQLRVEHLSIQLVTRQTTPAAFAEDTQYRFSALHYAYLLVVDVSGHLFPFALRPAFPTSVAERDVR
jgi:hypothetical protein